VKLGIFLQASFGCSPFALLQDNGGSKAQDHSLGLHLADIQQGKQSPATHAGIYS
jgi:hypothetical protein